MAYNRAVVDDEGKTIFIDGRPAYVKSSETINEGSLYGIMQLVEKTATPIRIGETNLVERHSILLVNQTPSTIFVGFDAGVTTNGIPVGGEQERLFSVNPKESLDLFAYSPTTTVCTVVEVK
jgi:hypothetical protein